MLVWAAIEVLYICKPPPHTHTPTHKDSEIAELEEIIADIRNQHNSIKEDQDKLRRDKLECFQKCEKFEKDVEQISRDMTELKVLLMEPTKV